MAKIMVELPDEDTKTIKKIAGYVALAIDGEIMEGDLPDFDYNITIEDDRGKSEPY
jgi:hypothetical protein